MMTKEVFKKDTDHLDAKTVQFKKHIEALNLIDHKINWEVALYMDDVDNDDEDKKAKA